jgi:hypothetical protein
MDRDLNNCYRIIPGSELSSSFELPALLPGFYKNTIHYDWYDGDLYVSKEIFNNLKNNSELLLAFVIKIFGNKEKCPEIKWVSHYHQTNQRSEQIQFELVYYDIVLKGGCYNQLVLDTKHIYEDELKELEEKGNSMSKKEKKNKRDKAKRGLKEKSIPKGLTLYAKQYGLGCRHNHVSIRNDRPGLQAISSDDLSNYLRLGFNHTFNPYNLTELGFDCTDFELASIEGNQAYFWSEKLNKMKTVKLKLAVLNHDVESSLIKAVELGKAIKRGDDYWILYNSSNPLDFVPTVNNKELYKKYTNSLVNKYKKQNPDMSPCKRKMVLQYPLYEMNDIVHFLPLICVEKCDDNKHPELTNSKIIDNYKFRLNLNDKLKSEEQVVETCEIKCSEARVENSDEDKIPEIPTITIDPAVNTMIVDKYTNTLFKIKYNFRITGLVNYPEIILTDFDKTSKYSRHDDFKYANSDIRFKDNYKFKIIVGNKIPTITINPAVNPIVANRYTDTFFKFNYNFRIVGLVDRPKIILTNFDKDSKYSRDNDFRYSNSDKKFMDDYNFRIIIDNCRFISYHERICKEMEEKRLKSKELKKQKRREERRSNEGKEKEKFKAELKKLEKSRMTKSKNGNKNKKYITNMRKTKDYLKKHKKDLYNKADEKKSKKDEYLRTRKQKKLGKISKKNNQFVEDDSLELGKIYDDKYIIIYESTLDCLFKHYIPAEICIKIANIRRSNNLKRNKFKPVCNTKIDFSILILLKKLKKLKYKKQMRFEFEYRIKTAILIGNYIKFHVLVSTCMIFSINNDDMFKVPKILVITTGLSQDSFQIYALFLG